MSGVYANPEDFGLQVVDEIDYSGGGYQFDLRVVWRHKETGKLYTARDAGCSCPSPFENYTKLEDLDELVDMTAPREEVRSAATQDYYDGAKPEITRAFLDKVSRTLRRAKQ